MNLAELLAKGAAVREGYEPRPVKWNNGEEVLLFDVQAKLEMSAADFEFLFFKTGDELDADRNFMARRVHRLALLDGDPIPFETAKKLKTDLLMAISAVLPNNQGSPAKN